MPVTCQQMQEIEAAAFSRGIDAAALMERAGCGIASVVRQFFPRPGLALLYLGKGNNAGDALVAGRELRSSGWRVALRMTAPAEDLKPLPRRHWQSIASEVETWESAASACDYAGQVVSLDGLLGIGATGPLRGTMRDLAAEMNRLRRDRHAATIAMDIPSGLDGDTGQACEDAVIADITVTIGAVKTGLLADAAAVHAGRIALVELPELQAPGSGSEIITSALLRPLLPVRAFTMHKGEAGRVGIVAGSRGFLGAAVLASLGALRGGAGLITLYAKPDAYDLLAMKVPPEIMVKCVSDYAEAMTGPDVLAIGPGLGFDHEAEVLRIIREARQPVVIDADALTMLARQSVPRFPGARLLTPHPGEMARFEPPAATRATQAKCFAAAWNVTLLLKGSRTVVATPDEPLRYNTTGTPGMASGGMGDVLAGLCAALIAQGMGAHAAASAGSWLLGRAAEIAIARSESAPESLSATDVAAHLGAALLDLKLGAW